MKKTIDVMQEARQLLDETIKTLLPPEEFISTDGVMESNVESLFLSVKNSPHTREQAKRVLVHQLGEQIKLADKYDQILERVPTEAIPSENFDEWYESWSDTFTHLIELRQVVQSFQF